MASACLFVATETHLPNHCIATAASFFVPLFRLSAIMSQYEGHAKITANHVQNSKYTSECIPKLIKYSPEVQYKFKQDFSFQCV
jgi:hypothetical protein